MRKITLIFLFLAIPLCNPAFPYWVWTPESGKWENPKYAAKDTPEEQFKYAMSFYKTGNLSLSLKEFKKLIKYYPLAKEAPTAQYYIGRIMEDMDRPYDAFKAYQKVIDQYPYTDLVDDVIEREYKIAEMFFTGKKLKVLGPLGVPAKDKAIEIFKAVVDNAPFGKYADISLYNAGLAYKEINDYENAIMMFKNLIDKYPKSPLIDKARYQLAESSKSMSLKPDYDQTPTMAARKEFEDFIEKHPESELAGEAKDIIDKLKDKEAHNAYKIAEFYESRRKPESAIIYYKDIIKNYPGTEWASKAQERLNVLEKK